jgi:hypothetical protein
MADQDRERWTRILATFEVCGRRWAAMPEEMLVTTET